MPWHAYGPDALTGSLPALGVTVDPIPSPTPGQHQRRPSERLPDAPGNALPTDLWVDRFTGARTPLKAALLDQRRIAGIGNIYADEILHQARLHPMRPAGLVNRTGWRRVAASAAAILNAAIGAGGSTIRDYLDADRQPGHFADRHAVYGRAGQPCRRCGRRLQLSVVSGRSTVHCTRCQSTR